MPKDVTDPNPFAGADVDADASVNAPPLDPFAGANVDAVASVNAPPLDPVSPGLPWAKILIGCGVGVVALTLLVALLRRRPPLRTEEF